MFQCIGNFDPRYTDFRLYYSPSKINISSTISENKRDTEQRSGAYTESYGMNLTRKFSFLTHFSVVI